MDPLQHKLLSVWQLCYASTCNELQRKRGVWYSSEQSRLTQKLVRRPLLPTGYGSWLVDKQPISRCQRPRGSEAVSARVQLSKLAVPWPSCSSEPWLHQSWGTSGMFQSQWEQMLCPWSLQINTRLQKGRRQQYYQWPHSAHSTVQDALSTKCCVYRPSNAFCFPHFGEIKYV